MRGESGHSSCPGYVDLRDVPDEPLEVHDVMLDQSAPEEVLHHFQGDEVGEGAEEPGDEGDGGVGHHSGPEHLLAQAGHYCGHKVPPHCRGLGPQLPQAG